MSCSFEWCGIGVLDLVIQFGITILGILIVLWLESFKKPKLEITTSDKIHTLDKDDVLKRPPSQWRYVSIHNKPLGKFLSRFWDRSPALSCRAWVQFYSSDGNPILGEMLGRWSETQEPAFQKITIPGSDEDQTKPQTASPPELLSGKSEAFRMLFQETVDIPPGEHTDLDIVMKFEGEEDCYGWNNESYINNWRNPWKMPKGEFFAKVRVKTIGREVANYFRIINNSYSDFEVKDINQEGLRILGLDKKAKNK